MSLTRSSVLIALSFCVALTAGCSKSGKAGHPEEAVKKCLAACEKQDVEIIWSLAPRAQQQHVEELAKKKGASSGKDFIEKNKAAFAEEAKNLAEAKIVEKRSIPGAMQVLLYPSQKNRALVATVILEEGGWKTFLPAWESIYYDGSAKFFIVQQDKKGELGKAFLEAVQAKPRKDREQFIDSHKRQTITVSGTVKDVMPGGIGGGGWFFYLESPNAPPQEKDRLEIQVGLDKRQFFSSTSVGEGIDGVATCKYFDGTTETIKPGQKITVTGIVWGGRGDWFGGSLLWIESAIVNK